VQEENEAYCYKCNQKPKKSLSTTELQKVKKILEEDEFIGITKRQIKLALKNETFC